MLYETLNFNERFPYYRWHNEKIEEPGLNNLFKTCTQYLGNDEDLKEYKEAFYKELPEAKKMTCPEKYRESVDMLKEAIDTRLDDIHFYNQRKWYQKLESEANELAILETQALCNREKKEELLEKIGVEKDSDRYRDLAGSCGGLDEVRGLHEMFLNEMIKYSFTKRKDLTTNDIIAIMYFFFLENKEYIAASIKSVTGGGIYSTHRNWESVPDLVLKVIKYEVFEKRSRKETNFLSLADRKPTMLLILLLIEYYGKNPGFVIGEYTAKFIFQIHFLTRDIGKESYMPEDVIGDRKNLAGYFHHIVFDEIAKKNVKELMYYYFQKRSAWDPEILACFVDEPKYDSNDNLRIYEQELSPNIRLMIKSVLSSNFFRSIFCQEWGDIVLKKCEDGIKKLVEIIPLHMNLERWFRNTYFREGMEDYFYVKIDKDDFSGENMTQIEKDNTRKIIKETDILKYAVEVTKKLILENKVRFTTYAGGVYYKEIAISCYISGEYIYGDSIPFNVAKQIVDKFPSKIWEDWLPKTKIISECVRPRGKAVSPIEYSVQQIIEVLKKDKFSYFL